MGFLDSALKSASRLSTGALNVGDVLDALVAFTPDSILDYPIVPSGTRGARALALVRDELERALADSSVSSRDVLTAFRAAWTESKRPRRRVKKKAARRRS